MMSECNLKSTFAVIKPDLSVEAIPVTDNIYQILDAQFNQFKSHSLVAMHVFESNWETWERHPAGDEIVVLMSGSAKLVLRRDFGDETIVLNHSGAFTIVPRNIWHTALISEKTSLLFITPGENTENHSSPKGNT